MEFTTLPQTQEPQSRITARPRAHCSRDVGSGLLALLILEVFDELRERRFHAVAACAMGGRR